MRRIWGIWEEYEEYGGYGKNMKNMEDMGQLKTVIEELTWASLLALKSGQDSVERLCFP